MLGVAAEKGPLVTGTNVWGGSSPGDDKVGEEEVAKDVVAPEVGRELDEPLVDGLCILWLDRAVDNEEVEERVVDWATGDPPLETEATDCVVEIELVLDVDDIADDREDTLEDPEIEVVDNALDTPDDDGAPEDSDVEVDEIDELVELPGITIT